MHEKHMICLRFFVSVINQSPGLHGSLAAAYNPGKVSLDISGNSCESTEKAENQAAEALNGKKVPAEHCKAGNDGSFARIFM